MHLRSIFRDGWLCTAYEPGPLYEGTEGELYELAEDPLQWRNLWDDPAYRARRDELVTDLYDNLPPEREHQAGRRSPGLTADARGLTGLTGVARHRPSRCTGASTGPSLPHPIRVIDAVAR